jgi:hypothetical protein
MAMSDDSEKIKRLISFKQKLEKRVAEMEFELKELQATVEAINSVLLEKGFKRAEITKPPAEAEAWPPKEEAPTEPYTPPSSMRNESITLKAATGEVLATLHASDDSLRVVLAEDKNFPVDTPPFTPFLLERVLGRMLEKDNELVKTGQIDAERAFSYDIIKDGNVVREIVINHVDDDRLRELKSSIRWTLEKMYEKIKSES